MRSLLVLIAGLVCITAAAIQDVRRERHDTMVTPSPAPMHVEWESFPVSGYTLIAPLADSTGIHPMIVAPEGAYLQVPHLVMGADPDSVQSGA